MWLKKKPKSDDYNKKLPRDMYATLRQNTSKVNKKKNKQKNNLNEILYYIVIVRSQKRRI